MNKKYKGIIFDLDGTLLNTIDDICDSLNYSLSKNLNKEVSLNNTMYFVGSGVNKLIERALNYLNLYTLDNFLKVKTDYLSEYKIRQSNKTAPYHGIISLIKELKNRGYKIAVLSNKPDDDTKRVIEDYFGLASFDLVWGKKPEYEVKPNPTSLLALIDALGLSKEEVIYCGDSDVDVMTAKNANVTSLAVSWGFRTQDELEKLSPDYIINESSTILKLLEE